MSKRGVVIAGLCDARRVDDQVTVRAPHLSSDLMRAAILYWDRIEIPNSPFASIELPPEYETLFGENILSRKMVPDLGFKIGNFIPGMGGSVSFGGPISANGREIDVLQEINDAPITAFEEITREESNVLWSYFRNLPSPEIPDRMEILGRSLLFEICDALPIPPPEVPVEKILEFKQRRKDELLSLREETDRIYYEISNACDIAHAKAMQFDSLARTLADLKKVSEENWTSRLARSLRYEINPLGMAAAVASLSLGAPLPLSVIMAFGSCFRLELSDIVSVDKNLPQRGTPYKYILDAGHELGCEIPRAS